MEGPKVFWSHIQNSIINSSSITQMLARGLALLREQMFNQILRAPRRISKMLMLNNLTQSMWGLRQRWTLFNRREGEFLTLSRMETHIKLIAIQKSILTRTYLTSQISTTWQKSRSSKNQWSSSKESSSHQSAFRIKASPHHRPTTSNLARW